MTFITVILFIIGFFLLLVGAELLVRGASTLAESAGISPLVVGLTVVAYGTSAPELAVTLRSLLSSTPQSDLAIGNVVGSNISNILLVLGLSALVAPLTVSRQLVRGSVPLMIIASIGTLALCWNGTLSRIEGTLMFVVAVVYTGYAIYQSRRQTAAAAMLKNDENVAVSVDSKERWKRFGIQIGLMVAGLALLLVGAHLLVEGAVKVAKHFGVS
ncbi:MAG: cation:H+ antiporter, partial [Pirellulaceae bacterium]